MQEERKESVQRAVMQMRSVFGACDVQSLIPGVQMHANDPLSSMMSRGFMDKPPLVGVDAIDGDVEESSGAVGSKSKVYFKEKRVSYTAPQSSQASKGRDSSGDDAAARTLKSMQHLFTAASSQAISNPAIARILV
jgi:hypothetical protein